MPEKDELDLLLDSALATYADPGADSGLEQRVLTAVGAARAAQAAPAKPSRRWLPWAIAIPVAAGLLILWLSIGKTVHAPSTQPQFAAHPNSPVNASQTAETSEPAHPKHASGAKAHRVVAAVTAPFSFAQGRLKPCPDTQLRCGTTSHPKLDRFPSPAPLSAEERALVAVADAGPPSQREALIESQQHIDAPLSIAALDIPPLAALGEGKN